MEIKSLIIFILAVTLLTIAGYFAINLLNMPSVQAPVK